MAAHVGRSRLLLFVDLPPVTTKIHGQNRETISKKLFPRPLLQFFYLFLLLLLLSYTMKTRFSSFSLS